MATSPGQDVLRVEFVGMLFALAVSDVAVHAAELWSAVPATGSWFARLAQALPALAHLVVGLILIAASWVGWQQSHNRSNSSIDRQVKFVVSIPFVLLLLDVLLVVFYFILVRNVEIEQPNGQVKLGQPSAWPEAFWTTVVFGTYAIWDFLTDVYGDNWRPTGIVDVRVRRRQWTSAVFVACLVASGVCTVLAGLAAACARAFPGDWSTIWIDVSLLSVIVLFRQLKAFEPVVARRLGLLDCTLTQSLAERVFSGRERLVGCWAFRVYILALLCAWLATR